LYALGAGSVNNIEHEFLRPLTDDNIDKIKGSTSVLAATLK